MGEKADVYTRTGDEGMTGLLGGSRVAKDSPQVEAYGTVDELNAALGVVKAMGPLPDVGEILSRLQEFCYHMNAEIASDEQGKAMLKHRMDEQDIAWIEGLIDGFDQKLPKLTNFIVPATTPPAAFLNQARTLCRRAERRVWTWSRQAKVNPHLIVFLNRLSDFLFTLMRYEGQG
ncbi:MAG: cob(I)yrinic acid a,c-diamide adenosyltransferase [Phycisphaeraceae bacterium]|nr:cob(I)yrinic acid a,c-diamide adenosyltransferase [Phycisphaeraceae bacterium]